MRMSAEEICDVINRNPGLQSELRSIAQWQAGWTYDLSIHNLVRLLNLEETARRIDMREASLLFNGVTLVWLESGRIYRQWPATSGKRGYSGPEHQAERNLGPIPAGRYKARQGRMERWDDTGFVAKLLAIVKRGPFPSGPIAWGHHRVWLEPLPGTQTYGRSNFSIHGGWVPGSIGCIDLTNSMDSFIGEFIYYAKDMDLAVTY